MILSKQCDRLYLQRDSAQNIYTDIPVPLPQHQLDGIRFLFRQFKKKAPGVIINDPSGYGKQLQGVLFLNALRSTLKKPILVLSNAVDSWKEQFEKWTNCSDDIAVESPNPYTAKQIFINPVKDGVAFSRRSWSIVVAHDEQSTKELLKINFNTDFKIWVTACDLKEDLHTLAAIYEWLHPNQRFNASLFTANKTNLRDVVEKALLLDAFLEDFLLRRTDFLTPFDKPKKHIPSKPSPVKATRKNKDPTGTKVKRSRRRIIEDDEDDNITNFNETVRASNDISKDIPISNDVDNNMDVESFIRNEKPIQSEVFNLLNSNETSQESITVSVTGSAESMDIDYFSTAVKELVEHEKSLNISRDSQNSHNDPGNSFEETGNNIAQGMIEETKDNENEENINGIIVPATEESHDVFSNYDENNKNTKRGVVIPETDIGDNTQNDNHSLDGEKSEKPQSNVWKINEDKVIEQESMVSKDDTITGDGDKGGVSNDNTNLKTYDIVKKKTKMEEFDAELAEIEAKALKRFKGSILDSLF